MSHAEQSTTVGFGAPRERKPERSLLVRGFDLFPRSGSLLLERRFLAPAKKRVRPLDLSDATRRLELTVGRERVLAGVWGDGPLVILVHGWSGGASQLDSARRRLVARGYRVATFDAPAHGGSPGREANVGQFASAVESLTRRLGPAHALLGHSLGGAAAVLAASRGASARGLVLLAPLPSFDFALDGFRAAIGFSLAVRERLARRIESRTGLTRDQVRLDSGPLESLPTLLVHDAKDRSIAAAHSREIGARHPRVEYVETDGLGHHRLLKDDALLDRVEAFLDSLPGSRARVASPGA